MTDAGPHERYMRVALDEARKGLGRTSPNPSVGAVVVKDGEIVATGYTSPAGGPHAEVVALDGAGALAQDADLYVTLEPCNHVGRTGPCSTRVIESGIARVFVASPDPNPFVTGGGTSRMREAGLEVEVGLLREEGDRLIEPWIHFITEGRPFVTMKVASTLDGRIATRTGDSRWITGEEARASVHRLRNEVDAVIVGRGTVEADDPQLTARIPGGRDPVRVVLDSELRTNPGAQLLSTGSSPVWIACAAPASPPREKALRDAGAEILPCRPDAKGRVDLDDLLVQLAVRGIVHVLVEGGAGVFGSFLEAGHCDRLLLHVGPKIFGGGPSWTDAPAVDRVADAPGFSLTNVERVGDDLVIEARPRETSAKRASNRVRSVRE